MRLVVKKREITDAGQLQTLVMDHVDGIEPGLAVLDSRLLLGQATIDVVGLDARSALVLMAVGFTADEEMLLKAVEAYSWCLEYPEAIRRLYPAAQVSSSKPPRLMFVIERMPDSFHRKIKQLGFPEVDCVEFRNLDVDGTPAVYFDTLVRLRRGPVAAAPAPVPAPALTPVPPAPAPTGRPTSLKLQKLLGADRPGPVREPAQVVSIIHRTAPRLETPKTAVIVPKLESVAAPRPMDEPARPVTVVEAPAAVPPPAVPEFELMVVPPSIAVAPEPVVAPAAPLEDAAELDVAPDPVAKQIMESVVEQIAEPAVEQIAEPEVEDIVELVVEQLVEPTVEAVVMPEPITEEACSDEAEPVVSFAVEPELAVVTAEPEPIALARAALESSLHLTTTPDPEPVLAVTADPLAGREPQVTVKDAVPVTPAPSVFARRPVEPTVAPSEPKVSFADAAKDLLAVTNPTPRTEVPATIQRPSVEEITRAAVDDLVGSAKPTAAAEEKTTAFAKPSGAFSKPAGQKRPRTIAPPPSDPQPIAGGKLGAAPKRTAPPVTTAPTAPEPAPAPTAQTEAAPPAAPQGFEGLQFPNDGVLTRQWMEFLNQMAAGK
jgi:hypothetical protein